MNKPASAPDVVPPRPPPAPGEQEPGEGTNATRHQPDPKADGKGPAERDGHKPRGPYVAGNT